MIDAADFQTLKLLCRRASSLPPLPSAVLRLVKEIDEADPSTAHLERIIASDPALTAGFLRFGSSCKIDSDVQIGTCIRSTILLLGLRAVKNLALSLMVQNTLSSKFNDCQFDALSCARHSLFVGVLAHYLAARPASNRADIVPDISDVFSAGVLHDLPLYLIARLAPSTYNRVHLYSRKREVSLPQGFQLLFGRSMHELGAVACETWNLPPVFAKYQRLLAEPWMAAELERGVCSIFYADYIATQTDWRLESWDVHEELPRDVLEEVDVPAEELALVVERVAALAETYCPAPPVAKVVISGFKPNRPFLH